MSPVAVHYGLNCGLLSLYGTQVCPFVDSLYLTELITPLLLIFGCLYAIRRYLKSWLASTLPSKQVQVQFKTDLTLFFVGGLTLALFNFLVYEFPVGSGLKVVLGMSALGFFTACDLALRHEHRLATQLSQSGQHIEIDSIPYPLTRKFTWFACACLVIFGVVLALIAVQDLTWLIGLSEEQDLQKAALLVIVEITFVLFVLLGFIMTIASNFGSNLKLHLDYQRTTLNQVAKGALTVRVPVTSNDEFGVIAKDTNDTIEALHARTTELDQMRDVTILALTSLAETRDNETGAHILRTQQYIRILAEHLKTHPRFKSVLTSTMVDLIYKSAPLHDSGKVGIPDAILLKPGHLTDEEFEIMKQHAIIGSNALQSAQAILGSNSFLAVACEIMETHHEKWDGSGYPMGLKGEQIPVSGRLMALADVYDALISERVYKPAFSHDEARKIIIEGKGTHFDPDVVDAFLALEPLFQEIALEFSDPNAVLRNAA